MTAWNVTGVVLGAVIGALIRWCAVSVGPSTTPSWTLVVVNTIGCAAMGYVLSSRDRRSERHQIALTVGFCGALTTFSGFVLDTAIVLDEQRWALALSYVTGTVLVSILAVVAGRHAGRVRGSNLDRRLS